MTSRYLAFFCGGLLVFSAADASLLHRPANPPAAETGTRICLELMDLDAVDATGAEEMELPPLKTDNVREEAGRGDRGAGRIELPPLKAGTLEKPARAEAMPPLVVPSGQAGPREDLMPVPHVALPPLKTPDRGRRDSPVPRSAPGAELSPIILPPPPPVVAEQGIPPLKVRENREAVPLEAESLMAVVPPAGKDTSLRLPSPGNEGMDATQAPEMPLLRGRDGPKELPPAQAPPLPFKSVSRTEAGVETRAQPPSSREAAVGRESAPAGDDLDRKLVEIYERYYRTR